jgi:hypothetical protein
VSHGVDADARAGPPPGFRLRKPKRRAKPIDEPGGGHRPASPCRLVEGGQQSPGVERANHRRGVPEVAAEEQILEKWEAGVIQGKPGCGLGGERSGKESLDGRQGCRPDPDAYLPPARRARYRPLHSLLLAWRSSALGDGPGGSAPSLRRRPGLKRTIFGGFPGFPSMTRGAGFRSPVRPPGFGP